MFLFGLGWLLSQAASAHELSGRVLNNGTGLNNAAIYLFDVNQQYIESRSDANGNFTFTNVSTGLFRLFAVPDIESNAIPAFFPNTPLYCDAEPIDISTDRNISIELETGTAIQTTLVIDDTPVEGALLKLTPDGAWTRGGFSDENGSVWVGGLPDGALLTVEVEGDTIPTQWITDSDNDSNTFGYDEREASWVEPSAINNSELIINPGITSAAGTQWSNAIPNANLSVYSNSQIRNTQSDDDGLYFAEGLPPGEALAWMSADGYANTYSPSDDRPISFEPILNEGEDYTLLDIDAPLESTVSITLLDANTEEPIHGASILLTTIQNGWTR